jgi:protein CMS1
MSGLVQSTNLNLVAGALAADRLEQIVIDVSHIDQKQRGILDMKDTQIPLTKWLNRRDIKDRYSTGTSGIDLLFY